MSLLVVSLDAGDVEACSDWLFQLGARAIEERGDTSELGDTEESGDTGKVLLVAGFGSDDLALAARSVLGERWPCRLESTGDETEWRDEWLKWIEPIQVADFIVHAPWHDPAQWKAWPDDLVELSIDPGRAFGSGHHPTTRMALQALSSTVMAGASVLDVGCGTGILSIAAAKAGATSVLGIDLDYDIIEVAAANVEANGVAASVVLRTDPLGGLTARFDIAVANIVVGDLTPLMPAIMDRADTVIVSGFLDDQFERVLADVDALVIDQTSLEGWGCATLTQVT